MMLLSKGAEVAIADMKSAFGASAAFLNYESGWRVVVPLRRVPLATSVSGIHRARLLALGIHVHVLNRPTRYLSDWTLPFWH